MELSGSCVNDIQFVEFNDPVCGKKILRQNVLVVIVVVCRRVTQSSRKNNKTRTTLNITVDWNWLPVFILHCMYRFRDGFLGGEFQFPVALSILKVFFCKTGVVAEAPDSFNCSYSWYVTLFWNQIFHEFLNFTIKCFKLFQPFLCVFLRSFALRVLFTSLIREFYSVCF